MEILLDKAFAEVIKGQCAAFIEDSNKTRDESKWHVSDLLAPKFAYYKRVMGYKITSEDVDMFIPGVAFHLFLQKVLGEKSAEVVTEISNILGTIDWIDKTLVEIKTSRKYTIPEMPEDHYVDQAKCYMVSEKRLECNILVMYFTAGRNPWKGQASTFEVVSWKLSWSQEESDAFHASMVEVREMLDDAVAKKDCSAIPLCDAWRCGSFYKEKEKLCAFYGNCKPQGRYPIDVLKKVLKVKGA